MAVIQQLKPSEKALLKNLFEKTHPLPKLLATVRSRRVGRGYSIEPGVEQIHAATGHRLFAKAGPLQFVSKKDPIALTELEEAVLAWSAGGPNGLIAWDIGVHTGGGGKEFSSAAGLNVPSPGNDAVHAAYTFIVNDNGVHMYKPGPERSKPVELEDEKDYDKIMKWYRGSTKRILNKRPDISWATRAPGAPNATLFGPYQYNLNKPGSSWFIPVYDCAWLMLGMMASIFADWHLYFIDDQTKKPAGLDKWIKPGMLEFPLTISGIEWFFFQVEQYPVGCMLQNLRLVSEGMGLGTWSFCGYFDDVLMGAFPSIAKGFQMQSTTNDKVPSTGSTQVLGIPGVLEATRIPGLKYKTPEEAVKGMYETRYTRGGVLAKEDNYMLKSGGPYKADVIKTVVNHPDEQIDDWVLEAIKAYLHYCIDKYGQWPINFNPLQAQFSATVHHIDEEFYEKYYARGYITEQIRDHFKNWHPGERNQNNH